MTTSVKFPSRSAAAFGAFMAAASISAPSRAEPVYAWCAVSSVLGLGQPLCHFATLEQCTAFLNGLAGSCRPNARAATPAQKSGRGER